MKYPHVEDDQEWVHADGKAILVTWEDGKAPKRYCGVPYCRGECGLPGLFLPPLKGEYTHWKASDSSGCGPVFEPLREEWEGKRVLVPKRHRERMGKLRWT